MTGRRSGVRPAVWLALAVAAVLIVAGAVIGIVLAGRGGSPDPGPAPHPEPTPTRAGEEPVIDPATSQTFAMRDGAATVLNGVHIATTGAGENSAAFTVSGEGFEPISVFGPLGKVVEVPGWGLLVAESVEVTSSDRSAGDEPGLPRPEGVVHFRTDVDGPLEFATVFTVSDDGSSSAEVDDLRITVGSLVVDGTTPLVEIEIIGLAGIDHGDVLTRGAGDVIELDGWGTLTIERIDVTGSAPDGAPIGEVQFLAETGHMPQIDRGTSVG